jgi:hypothetical protein
LLLADELILLLDLDELTELVLEAELKLLLLDELGTELTLLLAELATLATELTLLLDELERLAAELVLLLAELTTLLTAELVKLLVALPRLLEVFATLAFDEAILESLLIAGLGDGTSIAIGALELAIT